MWFKRAEDRLAEWKAFRFALNTLPLADAISATTRLWSFAPFVNHYLVKDETTEWPDPWALLHENHYCDLAKVLGMFYTLYLCDHSPNLDMKIILCSVNNEDYNLLWINEGKYVLNYWHAESVNTTQLVARPVIKHLYTKTDLKLETY